MKLSRFRETLASIAILATAMLAPSPGWAAAGYLQLLPDRTNAWLQVQGDEDDEWRFQASSNLIQWTHAPSLGSVFSGHTNVVSVPLTPANPGGTFVRAVRADGLFDPNLLRTVRLTFTNANYTTLLANARNTSGNVPCTLTLDNGITVSNVGARYRGNTSYNMGGAKKSINLDLNYLDPDGRLMGYRAVNLNNAAGDETIMREPIYFNILRHYAPSPHGAQARVEINGANWGVYSMVDQLNNDLLDEWFPSHTGDRWRAPNMAGGVGLAFGGGGPLPPGGGGGGGFGGGNSAFMYLGAAASLYQRNYELKSDNSTNAWERLVHAIDVLNNTPAAQFRTKVEEVFAVDRWLWFLAVENVMVDDDSYWNKGADYAFYYEPESGRIHPVEHDGNESFAAAAGATSSLSPVQGATSTTRPLLYKFLGVPELRQRYLAHMRTVLEERFNPAYMTALIDHHRTLSIAAITADPKKNFSMTGYSNDVAALKTYVTNRYRFLTNHAELRPLPPSILAVYDPLPAPGPADIPFVTAQVVPSANEGIDSVWLYWRDKTYGPFSSAPMFDDGAHQDGAPNDGLYGGTTTNFPAGHKIHYYVEARAANTAKASAFSPARAEQSTYSYRVALSTASQTPVAINELMADNRHSITDPQDQFDDWIELRNLTDQPVSLAGRYLTDDPTNPQKWPFPEGTIIPANGYLLIWADENGTDTPGLHANFKLDKEGEQVLLIDTDANLNAVLDAIEFPAQQTDRSYGRSADNADAFISMEPSPGLPNPGG